MDRNYAKVIISQEGEKWLDKGQMWMYRNNLIRIEGHPENGAPVDIATEGGRYLGTGFYSETSHIVVRILTKNPQAVIDRDFSDSGSSLLMLSEKRWKRRILPTAA